MRWYGNTLSVSDETETTVVYAELVRLGDWRDRSLALCEPQRHQQHLVASQIDWSTA